MPTQGRLAYEIASRPLFAESLHAVCIAVVIVIIATVIIVVIATVIIFVIGARPCASCSKRVSFIIWLQFNFFYGSYCLIILLEVL